jgi:hypothetical protein
MELKKREKRGEPARVGTVLPPKDGIALGPSSSNYRVNPV